MDRERLAADVLRAQLAGTVVVDNNGHPRRVYHGSPRVFERFDLQNDADGLLVGPGFYFTEDPAVAATYAHRSRDLTDPYEAMLADKDAPNVRPAYLKLERPFGAGTIRPGENHTYSRLVAEHGSHGAATRALIAQGYDGITYVGGNLMGGGHEHRVWVAFDADAIYPGVISFAERQPTRKLLRPLQPILSLIDSDKTTADVASELPAAMLAAEHTAEMPSGFDELL